MENVVFNRALYRMIHQPRLKRAIARSSVFTVSTVAYHARYFFRELIRIALVSVGLYGRIVTLDA